MEENHFVKYLLTTLAAIAIVANLLFLNYSVFMSRNEAAKSTNDEVQPSFADLQADETNESSVSSQSTTAKAKTTDSCYPLTCPELINKTASSLRKEIKQATSSENTTSTGKSTQTTATSGQSKEFFIALGNGQTQSETYVDIAGVAASIDSTKYGNITSATFEVSMGIPTTNGRVYAQLYNVTDKLPVTSSEVSTEAIQSQLLTAPITLSSGNKLYQVQMKTTLRAPSVLSQARIHIITE